MSDKNFSWGILGLIVGIVAPVLAIVALAITGLADPVTVSALITVTISSITGLSGVMNPNRKFDTDTQVQHTMNEAAVAAEQARAVASDVKKMLQ